MRWTLLGCCIGGALASGCSLAPNGIQSLERTSAHIFVDNDASQVTLNDLSLVQAFLQVGCSATADQLASRANAIQNPPGTLTGSSLSPVPSWPELDYATPVGVIDHDELTVLVARVQLGRQSTPAQLAERVNSLQGLTPGTFTPDRIRAVPGATTPPVPPDTVALDPGIPEGILAGNIAFYVQIPDCALEQFFVQTSTFIRSPNQVAPGFTYFVATFDSAFNVLSAATEVTIPRAGSSCVIVNSPGQSDPRQSAIAQSVGCAL